jgi:peptidoglycan/LPS O-acetylase OafA/YrhL
MRERYLTIDGLRGVAAICVLGFHTEAVFGGKLFKTAYSAVDLFFVLSGFVIATSYHERLERGLTGWQFFEMRAIRFYPLYFLGLMIGLIAPMVSYFYLPFAIAGLPNFVSHRPPAWLFPFNIPSWTLLFEFIINMIYALTFRLWSTPVLLITIVASGILLLLFGGDGGGGATWASAPVGILRCCYAFPFGVLLHQLRAAGYRAPAIPGLACLAAFLALLFTPTAYVVPIAILVGAPLLTTFAISAEIGKTVAPVFSALGTLSYGLYAVHFPLVWLTSRIFLKFNIHPISYLMNLAFIATIPPACLLLNRYYDGPVRRYLTQALGRPRATLLRIPGALFSDRAEGAVNGLRFGRQSTEGTPSARAATWTIERGQDREDHRGR